MTKNRIVYKHNTSACKKPQGKINTDTYGYDVTMLT